MTEPIHTSADGGAIYPRPDGRFASRRSNGDYSNVDTMDAALAWLTSTPGHEHDDEINLETVATLIRHQLPAVKCYVEQTGGDTATIYLGEPYTFGAHGDQAVPVLAGPGWFAGEGWTNGRTTVLDFTVGYDQDQVGHVEAAISYEAVAADERVQRIADDMVRLYEAHPRIWRACTNPQHDHTAYEGGEPVSGERMICLHCKRRAHYDATVETYQHDYPHAPDSFLTHRQAVASPCTYAAVQTETVDIATVDDGDLFSVDEGESWHVAAVNMASMGTISCYAFPDLPRDDDSDCYRVEVVGHATAQVARP
jgi:hypothetical protein